MPLVRVDLVAGKSAEYRRAIGDIIDGALVDICKVPKDDRFQVFHELSPESHYADEDYLGIKRPRTASSPKFSSYPGAHSSRRRASTRP